MTYIQIIVIICNLQHLTHGVQLRVAYMNCPMLYSDDSNISQSMLHKCSQINTHFNQQQVITEACLSADNISFYSLNFADNTAFTTAISTSWSVTIQLA